MSVMGVLRVLGLGDLPLGGEAAHPFVVPSERGGRGDRCVRTHHAVAGARRRNFGSHATLATHATQIRKNVALVAIVA
ncbi:hypothetical protein JCM30394_07830 [Deferrisoma palaeochoriense]